MSKKTANMTATPAEQTTGALLETVNTLALAGKPVEILECDKNGIVKFAAPLSDLGLNPKQISVLKAHKVGFLADVVGEALVRGNLDRFSILMENKQDYARYCEKFVHKHFVTLADDNKACFRFHVSLLHRIHNDILTESIMDPAALSGAQEDGYICSGIKPSIEEEGCAPYDVVLRFFKEENWSYNEHKKSTEDRKIIESGIAGANGKFNFTVMLWRKREQVVIRSFLPVSVPEDKRPAIAEYITHANYGTIIGGFEMDFSDGEVAYKTSLDFENDRLSVALLRQMIRCNFSTFNRYWPGFFKVIYASADPAGAIKEIEDKK